MGIEKYRAKIERIDREIISLINERYSQVKNIGRWKRDNGAAIYVPEREKALLEKLDNYNNGPMLPQTLRAIYREIMSGALKLEHPLRISFLGPEGTFSHQAALARFGRSVDYHSTGSIAGVFRDIETGCADYGCVPIENSTEGAVNYTLDTLITANVLICAEINLPIHHNLVGRGPSEKVKRVYSHPQVFGQCRRYLQERMSGIEQVETSSTIKATECAAHEPDAAAIAAAIAAEIYQLNVIDEHIEDFSNNTTRFFILGKQKTIPTGDDKTSLCFAIKDKTGALYDCLKPLKDAGITMTMIESRPLKSANWEYCFYIDILGHGDDENVKSALAQLNHQCTFLKIFGSYPRNPNCD